MTPPQSDMMWISVFLDAMARAMGQDYATVHRGVYSRSADMTLAYEAARRHIAEFVGGKEEEHGHQKDAGYGTQFRSLHH